MTSHLGLCTIQIAAKRGGAGYVPSGLYQRKRPITRLHHLLQQVVACFEETRFRRIALGGVGKEIEVAAGKLGRDRKNVVGRLANEKAYMQFPGERGGNGMMDALARPHVGFERLPHLMGSFRRESRALVNFQH